MKKYEKPEIEELKITETADLPIILEPGNNVNSGEKKDKF